MSEENDQKKDGVPAFADSLKLAVEETAAEGRAIEVEKIRGKRKPQKVEPSPATVTISGERFVPAVRALGNLACRRFDVTMVSDAEAREISDAMAPVAHKYLGDAAEKYGPEIGLGMVLIAAAGPRVAEYVEKNRVVEDGLDNEFAGLAG